MIFLLQQQYKTNLDVMRLEKDCVKYFSSNKDYITFLTYDNLNLENLFLIDKQFKQK